MGIFFGLGPAAGVVGVIAGILFGLARRRKPSGPPAP
jgi:hypothetical protein